MHIISLEGVTTVKGLRRGQFATLVNEVMDTAPGALIQKIGSQLGDTYITVADGVTRTGADTKVIPVSAGTRITIVVGE